LTSRVSLREGDSGYRGDLDVRGDGRSFTVTVRGHTERVESPELEEGIAGTLASINRLVETDQA